MERVEGVREKYLTLKMHKNYYKIYELTWS